MPRFTILFCCQKASIKYMAKHKGLVKTIFSSKVGSKYLNKIETNDETILKQYQQSEKEDIIYVIDIKNDEDNISPDKINLEHMGVILTDTRPNDIEPRFNIYNIGILCFMSCLHCQETGCPGKSSCSKLATDILRLWNTLGYNPKNIEPDKIRKIKKGIQDMFFQDNSQFAKSLPEFIRDVILEW